MENIRQRLMAENAGNFYPDLTGVHGKTVPSIVTVSSSSSTTSSSSSRVSKKPQIRGPNTIVISSDEEDEVDQLEPSPAKAAPLKPSNGDTARASQAQANVHMKSAVSQKPSGGYPFFQPQVPKSTGTGVPIHVPSDRQLPNSYDEDEAKDGETVKIPDFQDDYRYVSPAEAEKELRDLMGGAMNDSVDVDFDPEDAYVKGFKEGFKLLPHQVISRTWMKGREDPGLKRMGGILADDMGLGKTIQTLTRIVDGRPKKSDKEAGWDAATLVVCPLALVNQWAEEAMRITEGLTVVKHQGTSRTADPKVLKRAHIVVTTYDTLKSEYNAFKPSTKDESASKAKTKSKKVAEDDSESSEGEYFGRTLKKDEPKKSKAKKKDALFHVQWFRVVLDEAHNIKNRKTNGAIACCELEAKYRWALTGTPMQNDVTELYSLFKFLRIKPFSVWEKFDEQIAKPVKNGRGANRAMKRLQVVLQQVMLRRRKDDMLNGKVLIELPKRIVNIISCPFSPSEQAFYTSLETRMESVIEKLMLEAQRAGGKANYMSVLLLLLRLRQACNHPALVSKDYKADLDAVESKAAKKDSDDVDGDDLVAAFGQLGVTRKCKVCTVELTSKNSTSGEDHCVDCAIIAVKAREEARPDSAKIRKVLQLLKEVDERSQSTEKTIIFSQFTSMLDLIQPFLKDNGIRYVRYDGSMKPDERQKSIDAIKSNKDVRVILISFKAGSTGLNLTACNNVILVDLWWNPALEDQAFDRSHRFGQKLDVNIYKLKIDNTVEDRILELQEKKRELARAALSGDKIKNMRLGMDDLLALFRPGGGDGDDD